MRTLKMVVPAVMFAGLILFSAASFGKPAYGTKEKKACTFCHAKQDTKEAMTKNLTEAGKYYQTHEHSMEGYKGK